MFTVSVPGRAPRVCKGHASALRMLDFLQRTHSVAGRIAPILA